MHHEKHGISGSWDSGIAMSYHNEAYQGEQLRSSNVAALLKAATTDQASFLKLIDLVSAHLSPKLFTNLYTYDVIVPVPPSNRLGSSRGGDLVFEVAKELSIRHNMVLFSGLRTTRNVPSLRFARDEAERVSWRQDLYTLDGGDALNGKKVLIFDDVINTGATLNEVVKTIRQHSSPERVEVLTITTTGGVKRHTTLQAEATKEMVALHKEYSVSDDDEDAYLSDGVWVTSSGQMIGR